MPSIPPALTHQQSSSGTWVAGGQLQQLSEYVPELRWPNSVFVYERMRRDSKCASVLRAMTMPVRATGWRVVDSPDVRPEVAQFVRTNLGLIEEGSSRQRRRGQGLSWDAVLRDASLSLPFGHVFLEPVYQVGPPNPGDTLPPGQYAHLSRLAPILPATITGFDVAPDGSLVSITQTTVDNAGRAVSTTIPAARIVPIINEREGGDWTGTSVLRAAYKNWYLKDQLERIGVQVVERNGMGLPVAKYAQDGDRNDMLRMATAARAGEMSGVAIRQEDDFTLQGVTGQLVDPMPQILYHGQEIARSVLAMFLDLGHDNGARSLGDTFVDFFTMSLNAVVADLSETFTESLSRDLVALNFGDGEAYPEIAGDPLTPFAPDVATSIAALVTAGALTHDAPMEDFIRRQFSIPPLPADEDGNPMLPEKPEPPTPVVHVLPGGLPADPTQSEPTDPKAPEASSSPAGAKLSGVTLPEQQARLGRLRASLARRRGR